MSETPKFTPGPWYVGAMNAVLFVIDQPPRPSTGEPNHDAKTKSIAIVTIKRDLHAYEANAHLMAAAPELYEALEMVRDGDDDAKADGLPHMNPSARARVDAALAKAEGGK